MIMKEQGCLVCGDEIKAKYLCSKHHQRFIRTGSVYKKGEKIENPIDLNMLKKPKIEMGLSKRLGV